MNNILLDALTKIAEGTYPCTPQEAFIFTDIAQDIARQAVEKFTSTNNGSTSPSEIADSMEAACFPEPGEFIMPRESWLKEWCRQLRTCR